MKMIYDRLAWQVPEEIEARNIPWPYAMIAATVRRRGGELLPGPWERRVIAQPPGEPVVVYVFPAVRFE